MFELLRARAFSKLLLHAAPPIAMALVGTYLVAQAQRPPRLPLDPPKVSAPAGEAALVFAASDAAARGVRVTRQALAADDPRWSRPFSGQSPVSAAPAVAPAPQRSAAPKAAAQTPVALLPTEPVTLRPPLELRVAPEAAAASPAPRSRVAGIADATWQFGKRSVDTVTGSLAALLPERLR